MHSLTSLAFIPPNDAAEVFDNLVDDFLDQQEFNSH